MAANPLPSPAKFVPAFEVIRGRRPTGGREIDWLKDTRWRGGLNRELRTLGYRTSKIASGLSESHTLAETVPLRLAPDQVQLIEQYWADGLAHKVARSVTRKLPAPFLFDHPRYGGCQEFLSEAAYWLVVAVARYQQLPGVDLRAPVRKRMAGGIWDLARQGSCHHALQVRCESCGGTGADVAGGCKCIDCRGHGYTFTPNVDSLLQRPVHDGEAVVDHCIEVEDLAETPLETLLNREARSSIWEAVDRLPDLQRKLIRALFHNEVSQSEAARMANVSQPTVSRRLGAAKEALKIALDPLDRPISRMPDLPVPASRDDWWARLRKRHTPYTHGRDGANQRAKFSFHMEVSE